jgi:hypothetical protein
MLLARAVPAPLQAMNWPRLTRLINRLHPRKAGPPPNEGARSKITSQFRAIAAVVVGLSPARESELRSREKKQPPVAYARGSERCVMFRECYRTATVRESVPAPIFFGS